MYNGCVFSSLPAGLPNAPCRIASTKSKILSPSRVGRHADFGRRRHIIILLLSIHGLISDELRAAACELNVSAADSRDETNLWLYGNLRWRFDHLGPDTHALRDSLIHANGCKQSRMRLLRSSHRCLLFHWVILASRRKHDVKRKYHLMSSS